MNWGKTKQNVRKTFSWMIRQFILFNFLFCFIAVYINVFTEYNWLILKFKLLCTVNFLIDFDDKKRLYVWNWRRTFSRRFNEICLRPCCGVYACRSSLYLNDCYLKVKKKFLISFSKVVERDWFVEEFFAWSHFISQFDLYF